MRERSVTAHRSPVSRTDGVPFVSAQSWARNGLARAAVDSGCPHCLTAYGDLEDEIVGELVELTVAPKWS